MLSSVSVRCTAEWTTVPQISQRLNGHSCAANGDRSGVHLSRIGRRAQVGVENGLSSGTVNVEAARRVQLGVRGSSDQKRCRALGVRAKDRRRSRIRNIVQARAVAVGAEEQEVCAVLLDERRCLDEWAIGVTTVENLRLGAARGEGGAVGRHLLNHDGSGDDRGVAVVAVSAVANVVAIDFPCEVERAIGVEERNGVDGTTIARLRKLEIVMVIVVAIRTRWGKQGHLRWACRDQRVKRLSRR